MDSNSYHSIINSLEEQRYHKLIIGAALKDYQAIEDYSYLFTHAGAQVIDISAFPHSVISAQAGIDRALSESPELQAPAIMVSVNIGKDPHFRRIKVDFDSCVHCLKCVPTCPSTAFDIQDKKLSYNEDLCFACTKCLDDCHFDALAFQDWSSFETSSLSRLIELGASAIEIHLNNDLAAFCNFYQSLEKFPDNFLESFSIGSENMNKEELEEASACIIKEVTKKYGTGNKAIIIQCDGIPISGTRDIKDRDQASIDNAKAVIDFIHREKQIFVEERKKQNNSVYIQLAGGIDEKSLSKAFEQGVQVNGVAIGSSARQRLQKNIELARLPSSKEPSQDWQNAIEQAKLIIQESNNLIVAH